MREARDRVVSLVPRPGGHGLAFEAMLHFIVYITSALLTMCSTPVQLGSCEAQQYCFVNQCKNQQ